jgi:hypothetical protein
MINNGFRFEQLLAETNSRIRRELRDSNLLSVPGSEQILIDIIDDSIIRFIKTWEVNIPRKSPSLETLNCYDNKVIGYHYIDGIKRMIAQHFTENGVHYYTDGIKEKV